MAARISILMGVHNCESTLDESIRAILAQTLQDWEFIICDDASSDKTWGILQTYRNAYPQKFILLQNETNLGLPKTLNRCAAVASGELLARMDGDDTCPPDRFEKECAFLDTHPEFAIVSCDMANFDKDGTWGLSVYPTEPQPKDFVHGTVHCHAGCMMRAAALRAVGGYTEDPQYRRGQDYELWTRMYAAGYRGYNIHEPLYEMRDDRNAAARRTFKYRIGEAKIRINAIRTLGLPFWMNIYALRPILLGLTPQWLYEILHRSKLERALK